MTGLECLVEEMKRKGIKNTVQVQEATAVLLDIISKNGLDTYVNLQEVERQIRHDEEKARALRNEIKLLEEKQTREYVELQRYESGIKSYIDKQVAYIKNFQKALEECETSSGRDALKRAQMFINSVSVDTKYDNTAFIIGLAAILSEGNIGCIEELKKINSKIPEINGIRYCEKNPIVEESGSYLIRKRGRGIQAHY